MTPRTRALLTRETYLGDGLYASYDGYHVRLRAPRPEGDHVVALEPAVLVQLMHYLDDLRTVIEEARKEGGL